MELHRHHRQDLAVFLESATRGADPSPADKALRMVRTPVGSVRRFV
jgi:hypothetical protein